MSIPLDRLYNYIKHIAEEIYGNPIIIYRFYPHGSKKLEDLIPLYYYSWQELNLKPGIYCNDQEPLDYKFYENYKSIASSDRWGDLLDSLSILDSRKNLKRTINIHERSFLLHSEQRSANLMNYQIKQWIPIYYWSHALLALDWFRYAGHINIKRNFKKKFLIYNRAWTGTREYRLKFSELLINHELVNDCQTSVGFIDQNIHYKNHTFANTVWKVQHQLEDYFDNNTTASSGSADFTIEDYENTDIEVVLETLFDDKRLHLTEKSLRPIACGQPFILAATHGSLEYLRSYGFKTFNNIIDESYDLIEDPEKRLQAVVLTMKQIAAWTNDEKHYKMIQLRQISEYNKQHFFSNKFFNQIINELKENCSTAFTEFNNTKNCNKWIERWNYLLSHQNIKDFLISNQDTSIPTIEQLNIVYAEGKKYIK